MVGVFPHLDNLCAKAQILERGKIKYSSDFLSTVCPTHEDGFPGQRE